MKNINIIIFSFLLMTSCKPVVNTINGAQCKPNKNVNPQKLYQTCYFASGEENTFNFSNRLFWKIDSIQGGILISTKPHVVKICSKDSIFTANVFYKSKLTKRKHTEVITCGAKPTLRIQMYQGLRDSVVDFNNLLFFKIHLVNSPDSPEKIKLPTSKWYIKYNDSTHVFNGYFSHGDLLKMKYAGINHFTIDSISYFDYFKQNKNVVLPISKKISIDYERLSDYDDLWQVKQSNSLAYNLDKNKTIEYFNGYYNRYVQFYLFFGVCIVNIYDENGEKIESLKIDSEYRTCGDFIKLEPSQLYRIEVSGSHNYTRKLDYRIDDPNKK